MSDALIEVASVSQVFATRDGSPTFALRDVSLTIGKGEFVCLIGPSGCGKTTLMHLIAGFMTPTRGRISFSGTPVTGPSPDRGVVFQEYALFAWMTAQQNVEFGLRMRGFPSRIRAARALEALERVGLAHAANKYPHELSGGMRQRVAVARALVVKPAVLLMDEPFAAVDAITRQALQEDLLRLWRNSELSVIFVTHNIDEAAFLAQRVVVMSPHPGAIRADIAIDASYPRDRSSAAFGELYSRISTSLSVGTRSAA
ncbi:ABC transporter ATP-binding protein [Bradyrhizobium arachidis]|uniref:ABC transporter ATP-binding protein n=1 Tax=Bradyrhizobium arachidis TaxID=858423 RepID=A0AAE7TG03_9BRAD|nr:ABC transporter ATP-binding protein [Bradyrhizobium arachidis]QOZ67343.1 ABC transporter ATP-binding protein [Bradyrhizobium arachidis]SFU80306.1 NitT/TauT family transport system ATP-binding protein [Bradyrhizobium arachidis]